MRGSHIAALVAAMAGLVMLTVSIVTTGNSEPQRQLATPSGSIPQLPEQRVTPPTDPNAVADLDHCLDAGDCTLVHTRAFSNATIEVFQEESTPPVVHVRTVQSNGDPSVWSLKDEHAATFKAMTCGLANCLLDVTVGSEMVATIDLRMVADTLSGKIEGAAVGGSLHTQAADLNKDGVLDLIATEHLVKSDGTELTYYRTYVNQDRDLVPTGCTLPAELEQAPSSLQSRTCPTH
ncbi:hypothetical protein [Cumulibacter soli]|uniref:hypothetical protein n=1 Tax=Cumulibacter soli TaxID=2546344 RepID=UPI0010684CC8|nr:hypothetical protein [Cumulibacter soli]